VGRTRVEPFDAWEIQQKTSFGLSLHMSWIELLEQGMHQGKTKWGKGTHTIQHHHSLRYLLCQLLIQHQILQSRVSTRSQ
jgi:division protein CdvB (Snf7/Vps24/ESCRT-III family)